MPILEEEMTYEIMRSREKTHCCAQCPESYAANLRTAWGQSLGYGEQYILRCGNLSHATIRSIRISPTELDLLKLLKGEFELMPIKDLTERTMLPRIGKIHLGVKHPTKGYPMATDYFVFPEDHAQYKDLVDTFGAKPAELRIVFPINDEEQVASQYYRQYSQSRGLVCKGDGIECNQVTDVKTGALATSDAKDTKWAKSVCGGRECPDYLANKCKEVMNLQFMLPEIPGLGIWQIDTSSINGIINVNSSFDLIRAVYGTIAMVPILLSLEPKQVKSPVDGKLKTVRVMHIRSGDSLLEAAKKALMAPLERITGKQQLALPPGDTEAPEVLLSDGDPQTDIEELWDAEERPKGSTPRGNKTQAKQTTGEDAETPPEPEVEAGPDAEDSDPAPAASADMEIPAVKKAKLPTKQEYEDLKTLLRTCGMDGTDLGNFCNGGPHYWGVTSVEDLNRGQYETVKAALGTGVLKAEAK